MRAIVVPAAHDEGIDPSIVRLRASGPPRGVARARRAVRDGWLVAGRDMAQWVREPQMIVWGLVMPVMFVVLFAYVLGSAMVVPGNTVQWTFKGTVTGNEIAGTVNMGEYGNATWKAVRA
jgi:hypothetical protein